MAKALIRSSLNPTAKRTLPGWTASGYVTKARGVTQNDLLRRSPVAQSVKYRATYKYAKVPGKARADVIIKIPGEGPSLRRNAKLVKGGKNSLAPGKKYTTFTIDRGSGSWLRNPASTGLDYNASLSKAWKTRLTKYGPSGSAGLKRTKSK